MPGGAASDVGAPPSVPLSFSNNFWGRDDAGVDPLLSRMHNAKTTCDELKAFYNARATIEEDYSRKLLQLSRKALGSSELGTLRASLDVARGETESMGKQHGVIAQQMKSELEEPLAAFAGGMKERRKIVQTGIERLLKTKQAQTLHVIKSRDKYEQDCLRIKGYLAQGHMVMGQEERKNKAKLEKTQINMASNSNEYEGAVKVLEETTGRWNKDWKAACDKFQDLEEERLDFTKSSLWAFANIASTVCVSDDASCEKIRLALENCEVERDVMGFIRTYGTGQEIPDPPKFINFCRGDIDSASDVSEDDNYSVAQFSRTTNPAFRSSSPNPSARSDLMPQNSSRQQSEERSIMDEDDVPTPSKANSGKPAPLNYRQADPNVPPNYSPSQHGEFAQIPHNQYPTDGMTMFCRSGVPSVAGSALSAGTRPDSRDSASECSNPSSFTSADPLSGKNSPTKGMPPVNGIELPGMAPNYSDKTVQKKRSGFFSNSPFRRKSKKEQEHPQLNSSSRNTGISSSPINSSRINLNPPNGTSFSNHSSPTKSPIRQPQIAFNHNAAAMAPEGEEPADPRASFQLNIGNNVFDVASPDSHQSTPKASLANVRRSQFNVSSPALSGDDLKSDPVARALADLKQSSTGATGMAKQASTRMPVDRYHGVTTPVGDQNPASRPPVISAESQARLAAQRGTPPPAYDLPAAGRSQSALGVPQPAHTRREMMNRTETWGTNSTGLNSPNRPQPNGRPSTRDGRRSPGPGMIPRAASPQPQNSYHQQQLPIRARSPGPAMMSQGQGQYRAASPNPYAGRPNQQPPPSRRGSGMEMQISSQDVTHYNNDTGSNRSRHGGQGMRPASSYGGYENQQAPRGRGAVDPELRRERSKSMANVSRGPLHYARALYTYTAAIPEELSFNKGDILAVLRLQDDGWWEAEVKESNKGNTRLGSIGLVPSNYLQRF